MSDHTKVLMQRRHFLNRSAALLAGGVAFPGLVRADI